MKNIYEVQTANKVKSGVIVALFVVFVFIAAYILTNAFGYYIGYQPGGLGFFGMAIIISGISSFLSYYYSDKIVLGISGARPATPQEDKLFTQVVENLCIGAGLPKPKLYVIDDVSPNAFATGRDPDHAVICATSGLLSKLNRSEMEGVFGHELTHIKSYDTRLMAVVAVMVGLIALLGDWFLRSMWWGGGRRKSNGEGEIGAIFMLLGIIFAILSPIVGTLIQLAISRRREFMADAGSVEITRQPQDLISALKKIADDPNALRTANKATAHLYIENPYKKTGHGKSAWFSGLFDTHPPIPDRIKALQSMTQIGYYQGMVKLSKADVMHVANLAKLDLTDTEIKKFLPQLSVIVEHVAELQKVDTTGIDPTSQTTGLTNVFRQDEIKVSSLDQDAALSGTDETHNGYFKVPAILEGRTDK